MNAEDALYLQLEDDLFRHLSGRGWHEFETLHPREAFNAVYRLLERYEVKATVMISPRYEDHERHLVYIAKAMEKDDERGLDFAAARALLDQFKRLERMDLKVALTLEGGRPEAGSRSGPRLDDHQVLGGSSDPRDLSPSPATGGQEATDPRTRGELHGVKDGIPATDPRPPRVSRSGGN